MDYSELKKHRKIAWVSPDFLKSWINGSFLKYAVFVYPVISGAENAIIEDIFWDDPRRSFGIVLLDENFPVVESGCIPDSFCGKTEIKTIRRYKYDDEKI